MPKKVKPGPNKPTRISAKQGRKGQHSKSYRGDVYQDIKGKQGEFSTGANLPRGGRSMKTLPTKPTTKRDGGTRQSRIQRGRQDPL